MNGDQFYKLMRKRLMGDTDGKSQGSLEHDMGSLIFSELKPIKEAYQEWLNAPGTKKCLAGTFWDKQGIIDAKNTIKWAESGFGAIEMKIYPDANDYHFLKCWDLCVVVSEFVLKLLQTHNKGEFESFPVKITNEDVPGKYFVINVLNPNIDFTFGLDTPLKGLKND